MLCFYTEDDKTVKCYDQGADLQVLIMQNNVIIKERWFSAWSNNFYDSVINAMKSTITQELKTVFDIKKMVYTKQKGSNYVKIKRERGFCFYDWS